MHCKNKVVCLNPHKVTSVVAPVPENVQLRAVQLDHLTEEAKLNPFFFGEPRNRIWLLIVLMHLSFLLKLEK